MYGDRFKTMYSFLTRAYFLHLIRTENHTLSAIRFYMNDGI